MSIAKAIIATVIAGLTAVGTGLTDGHLTAAEWVAAAVAAAVALGAVYGVPNKTTSVETVQIRPSGADVQVPPGDYR